MDADTVGAASFQTQVAPLVAAKNCADPTGACHTIQAPFLTDYSRLAGKYKVKPGSTNVLVTKGEHQLRPFFDATEQAAVAAWIDSLP